MQWIFIILLALAQNQNIERLDDATDAYQRAEYDRAIALYTDAIESGIQNDSLYFNLASAYFQQEDYGNALVWYLRAHALAPRDTQTNEMISRIRALRADYQTTPAHWADYLADLTINVLTEVELGLLAFFNWLIWFMLISVAYYRRSTTMRAALLIVTITTLVTVGLFGSRLYTDKARPRAVITTLQAEVTSGPGNDYPVIEAIYSGAEVRILQTDGSYARFVTPDNRQGWISRLDYTLVNVIP
jgi:tetratricopeptide (TPR) repeat protein